MFLEHLPSQVVPGKQRMKVVCSFIQEMFVEGLLCASPECCVSEQPWPLPARSVWPHSVWWECAANELVLARVRPDGTPAGGGALTPHSGLDSKRLPGASTTSAEAQDGYELAGQSIPGRGRGMQRLEDEREFGLF